MKRVWIVSIEPDPRVDPLVFGDPQDASRWASSSETMQALGRLRSMVRVHPVSVLEPEPTEEP